MRCRRRDALQPVHARVEFQSSSRCRSDAAARPAPCLPSLLTTLHSADRLDTDPIVNFAVDLVDAIGLAGVFILMLLESACIPIPSEATMLFAGFKVTDGDMTLFGAVAAGVLGNLVGSWIACAAGYYGREELLERNRLIHINPKHLATGPTAGSAPRRGDGLLRADAADRPHLHLPARRRRRDALLAVHHLHRPRLHPLGAAARR